MAGRIAVLGSTGQLGSDVVQTLSESGLYNVVSFPHDRVDVADRDSVMAALADGVFDVVVNCAALTHVDSCEDYPSDAFAVNANGGFEVARACAKLGALCVFVSTDFVFQGDKGSCHTEEDCPAPINVYGVSKLAGELLVQQAAARWLILRVSSVFGKVGSRGKGGNFVEAILSKARADAPLRVINDLWMSPSYTMDVARTLLELIEVGATGLYHANNFGRCSWYEFACRIAEKVGLSQDIEPISSAEYPTKARRPNDSSMRSVRLHAVLGHSSRSWEEGLEAYLVETGHVRS